MADIFQKISAQSRALHYVFTSFESCTLPFQQRDYEWPTGMALALIEDMWDRLGTSGRSYLIGESEFQMADEFFLGMFVFQHDHENHPTECTIYDGQQRFTTVSLIMLACANILRRNNPTGHDHNVLTNMVCNLLGYNTGDGDGEGLSPSRPRLLLSDRDSDIYNELYQTVFYSKDGWCEDGNVRTGSPVSSNFATIHAKLHELFVSSGGVGKLGKVARNFVKWICHRVGCVLVTAKHQKDCAGIFSIVNTPGLPMGPSDFIKAKLWELWNANECDEKILSADWNDIQGWFSRDFFQYAVCVSFLLLTAEYGMDQNVEDEAETFKKMFDNINVRIDELKLQSHKQTHIETMWKKHLKPTFVILREIMDGKLIQQKLKNEKIGKKFRRVFYFLTKKPFSRKGSMPWLRCVLWMLSRRTPAFSETMVDAVFAIEQLLTTALILQKRPKDIRKLFSELQGELMQVAESEWLILIKSSQGRLIGDANLEDFISKLTYTSDRDLLCYILHRLEFPHDLEDKKMSDVDLGNTTLEHILPQRPAQNWEGWGPVQSAACLHLLGNLALVSCGTNSELSNHSWNEKKKILFHGDFQQEMTLTQVLDRYVEWNYDAFNDRHVILVKKTVNLLGCSESGGEPIPVTLPPGSGPAPPNPLSDLELFMSIATNTPQQWKKITVPKLVNLSKNVGLTIYENGHLKRKQDLQDQLLKYYGHSIPVTPPPLSDLELFRFIATNTPQQWERITDEQLVNLSRNVGLTIFNNGHLKRKEELIDQLLKYHGLVANR